MIAKLKDVTSVNMGYSFRSRLETSKAGNVSVIQMKDLTSENRVDCSTLARIDLENLKEIHFVKTGDLIFRSRGQVATSAILEENPGAAIVAAPLLRIRVTDERLRPEYLNWYISQPPAQIFFASHAKGTAQTMISKESLENLEIVIPPMATQVAITQLAALSEREQYLMKKISEKRDQHFAATLLQLAQGE